MHLHAEYWRARPAWRRLPAADRRAYLDHFRAGCSGACDPTLCLMRLAVGDADDGYLTVWRIADACGLPAVRRFLDEAGWTHYFAPIPARCSWIPLSTRADASRPGSTSGHGSIRRTGS